MKIKSQISNKKHEALPSSLLLKNLLTNCLIYKEFHTNSASSIKTNYWMFQRNVSSTYKLRKSKFQRQLHTPNFHQTKTAQNCQNCHKNLVPISDKFRHFLFLYMCYAKTNEELFQLILRPFQKVMIVGDYLIKNLVDFLIDQNYYFLSVLKNNVNIKC